MMSGAPTTNPLNTLKTDTSSLRHEAIRTTMAKDKMIYAGIGGGQYVETPETQETQTALDRQTGGTHYKQMAIQPAEYAEKNGLSLLEGNVVKYITRWKLKGQPLSDLEKAKHCIDLLIQIHDVK